jgi:hypothetical protein
MDDGRCRGCGGPVEPYDDLLRPGLCLRCSVGLDGGRSRWGLAVAVAWGLAMTIGLVAAVLFLFFG